MACEVFERHGAVVVRLQFVGHVLLRDLVLAAEDD